jgi:hypothetical protein
MIWHETKSGSVLVDGTGRIIGRVIYEGAGEWSGYYCDKHIGRYISSTAASVALELYAQSCIPGDQIKIEALQYDNTQSG